MKGNTFSSFKTSSRDLQVVLKDEKLLRVQDFFNTFSPRQMFITLFQSTGTEDILKIVKSLK